MHRMKFMGVLILAALAGVSGSVSAPAEKTGATLATKEIPLTLVYEARASIDRGAAFLVRTQEKDGSWLHEPAITGLACMALHKSYTNGEEIPERREAVRKGRRFMLGHVQPSGAIAGTKSKYVNYTTAICLSALAVLDNPEDTAVMRQARRYLIRHQLDENHPEHPADKDNPFYGGMGYGSAGPKRPDLSNTQWALEALHLTEHLATEAAGATPEQMKASRLAWDHALEFLKTVQNVPGDAGAQWVVDSASDPEHDGGFIYKPDESKATDKLQDEDGAAEGGLRSYGSMTYAGLKSMIYADLEPDDYRVKAATDWARRHYTLDENPGMGPEGHFYYLQTFAKAHAALGDEVIVTPEGEKHRWRIDLIRKLLELQKGDGSWVNTEHGRWMESIPHLVTSYALISMEVALGDRLADD